MSDSQTLGTWPKMILWYWLMTIYITEDLTPKHRETHGCVISTVATDALVLKHQAISIHNAD